MAGFQSNSLPQYTVREVVDGDTIDVEPNLRIRLAGIDTPNQGEPGGEPGFDEAKAMLTGSEPGQFGLKPGSKIFGKDVGFQKAQPDRRVNVFDTTAPPGRKGKKARSVKLLYAVDGTLIQAAILRAGWAVTNIFASEIETVAQQEMLEALREARRNKRGIWKIRGHPRTVSFLPDAEEHQEVLDDVERVAESRKAIPGATRLGTIWLYVPPSQIVITEHNTNLEIPTIHTPGSPRIKTSQQEKRIEMSAIFPDVWSINYQFRPILAQFIRSPVLPLRNRHIWELLNPPDSFKADVEVPSPPGVDQSINKQAAKELTDSSTSRFRKDNAEGLMQGDKHQKPRGASTPGKSIPAGSAPVNRSNDVFVVLRNVVVSTIPSLPQAVQAHFILNIFNHEPHMDEVRYIKSMTSAMEQIKYIEKLGRLRDPEAQKEMVDPVAQALETTADIGQSEPFKRYYKTLLAEADVAAVDGELNWGYGTLTPRLHPVTPEQMGGIDMTMEITENSGEDVQENADEITRLESEIKATIKEALRKHPDNARIFRRDDRGFIQDVKTQISASATAYFQIIHDTMFKRLADVENKFERALSENDIVELAMRDDMDLEKAELTQGRRTRVFSDKDDIRKVKEIVLSSLKVEGFKKGIAEKLAEIVRLRKEMTHGVVTPYNVSIQTGENTIISGMSGTFAPRITPISVIDHPHPSFQYFGKSDWIMSINIQTSDQNLIKRFGELSKKSRESRIAREKFGTRAYITKLNSIEVGNRRHDANGMFNLLGIGRVLIEDFVHESIKERPGWFNLSLRVVQSDLDISEYEKLIPVNFLSDEAVKRAIGRVIEKGISRKNSTLERLDANFRAAARQALAWVGVRDPNPPLDRFGNPITEYKDLLATVFDEDGWNKLIIAKRRAQIEQRIQDNPTPVSRFTRDTGAALGVSGVTGEILDSTDRAEIGFLLNRRIRGARLLFLNSITSSLMSAVAKNRLAVIPYFGNEANINSLKFRTILNSPFSTLHTCYPELLLPVKTSDPLITQPDFFYSKEDRIQPGSAEIVRKRLENVMNVTDKAAEIAGVGYPPEIVKQDLDHLLFFVKNQAFVEEKLSNLEDENASLDDILKIVGKGVSAGELNLDPITEEELKDLILQLEDLENATVPRQTYIAMKRIFLASEIFTFDAFADQAAGFEFGKVNEKPRDIDRFSADNLRKRRNELVSQYNGLAFNAKQGTLEDAWGLVTKSTIARSRLFLEKAVSSKTLRNRAEGSGMARIYPCAKLFFIEEDAKEWGRFDDYYSYSSIQNIRIVESDDTPGKVAQIRVSNLSARLSDRRPNLGEAPLADQTPQEQTVNSFLLREGTTIMIRMGYNNDPQRLDTTFIGKVVSVSLGDTVTIVAQSFGSELAEKIFKGSEGKLGFFSTARALGDVVLLAIGTMSGMSHFGNRSWLDILKTRADTRFRDPGNALRRYSHPKFFRWDNYISIVNPIAELVKLAVFDPRIENIYLPFTGIVASPLSMQGAKQFGKQLIKVALAKTDLGTLGEVLSRLFDKRDTVIESQTLAGNTRDGNMKMWTHNPTFDWYYNNQSLWEMLREMALYNDNYIVTTLPYNENIPGWQRETVYFGPRDGLYKYTEKFDETGTFDKVMENSQATIPIIPSGFSEFSEETKRKKTLELLAIERGMGQATELGRRNTLVLTAPTRRSIIVTARDTGTVEKTNYGGKRHSILGYYVLIKTSRSKAPIGPQASVYVLYYNLPDPFNRSEFPGPGGIGLSFNSNSIRDRIKEGSIIRPNEVVGLYVPGTAVLQRYFFGPTDENIDINNINSYPPFLIIDDAIKDNEQASAGLRGKNDSVIAPELIEATKHPFNIRNPENLVDPGTGHPLPGYTYATSYHFIDSRHDIIENLITVSAENIHNKVTIRFPGEPGSGSGKDFTVVADNNIPPDHIRHSVSTQPNVDPELLENFRGIVTKMFFAGRRGALPTKYIVAANLLAREMRQMYQGSIKIWGRPAIKKYDVVYINDMTNQIFGPIEVGEVTHEYSAENGFTTTIFPRAIITVRDQARIYHDLAMNGLMIPYYNKSVSQFFRDPKAIATVVGAGVAGTGLSLAVLDGAVARTMQLAGLGLKQGTTLKFIRSTFKHTFRALRASRKFLTSLSFISGLGATSIVTGAVTVAAGITLFSFGNMLWNKGIDKVMGRDIISVTGLFYQGKPMVAGLEGAFKDSYVNHFQDWIMSRFTFEKDIDLWRVSGERNQ